MNYSLSTAAEGFVPPHAPLRNNKHVNIPFQSAQPMRGKNKSESQGLTPSSWVRACGTKRRGWGCAAILSVMPNAATDTGSCSNGWSHAQSIFKPIFCCWGGLCSLLFSNLRPNYGGGNEDCGDLFQKIPCMRCHSQCPCPCSRPPPTHVSARNSWTLTGKSGSVSCGLSAPFA